MGHLTDNRLVARHLRRTLAENEDVLFLADDLDGMKFLATLAHLVAGLGVDEDRMGFGTFDLTSEAGKRVFRTVHFLTIPPRIVTPAQIVLTGLFCGYEMAEPAADQNVLVVASSEESAAKLAGLAMMFLDNKVYAHDIRSN